jgi:cytochrome P450
MTNASVSTTPAEAAPPRAILDYEDINRVSAEAFWHFANFDRLREIDGMHFGDASGHEFWLVTRMADIRHAMQHPEIYSNSAVAVPDPDPQYMMIPEMLDPPLHTRWRQLLGPVFAPSAVAALEERATRLFDSIVDELAPRGACDYVADVAMKFPNTVFMEIMGLPPSDAAQFLRWEEEILHAQSLADEQANKARAELSAYFVELLDDRRKSPRDDLLSRAVRFEIDGEPVTQEDLLSMCILLFMAGLDTVAMQLSFSMYHLATHEADRRLLVEHPEKQAAAIEEFLRYYSFVIPARKVMQDSTLGGCPVSAGQMIWIPLASANRDPREFPHADQVLVERPDNRHIAFGAGPHRCIGSHLARQELRIAMAGWLRRIPDFSLAEGAVLREHAGSQLGIDSVPLIWAPAQEAAGA